MPVDEGGSFQVIWSEKLLGDLKQAHAEAKAAGLGAECLAATRTIEARLRTAAREAGEERYHLHSMKLLLRHIVVAPMSIQFGVHEELDLVIIRRVQLLELHKP